MKTRIQKMVNQRVRIVELDNGRFNVETRESKRKVWNPTYECAHLKHAVNKKNVHIVMVIMRDLGYRYEFVKRRNNRKKRRLGLK